MFLQKGRQNVYPHIKKVLEKGVLNEWETGFLGDIKTKYENGEFITDKQWTLARRLVRDFQEE